MTVQAFLRKYTVTNPVTGCMEWAGGCNGDGYGRVRVRGRMWLAHRYVWFLIHGSFEKPCVLHTCDNPPCCNPDHLWNGTNADNVADRDCKGRTSHVGCSRNPASGDRNGTHTYPEKVATGLRHGRYTHPERTPRMKGETNGMSKLTAYAVQEIRRRYTPRLHYPHKNSVRAMAEEFGVHPVGVWRIISGKGWEHLL